MRKKLLVLVLIPFMLSFAGNQQEKKITITFTPEEVTVIYNALGELPAKIVEPLRAKIAFEYQKQMDTTKKK